MPLLTLVKQTFSTGYMISAKNVTCIASCLHAGKGLSVSILLYQPPQVEYNANSRFTLKSWKSPRTNSKDSSAGENQGQPQEQDTPQLRETSPPSAQTRPKLDVNSSNTFFEQNAPS
jgi:hypothetical protein